MSLLLILLFVLLVVVLFILSHKIYKVVKNVRHNIRLLKSVPGVPRHWFFGSVKEVCINIFQVNYQTKIYITAGLAC